MGAVRRARAALALGLPRAAPRLPGLARSPRGERGPPAEPAPARALEPRQALPRGSPRHHSDPDGLLRRAQRSCRGARRPGERSCGPEADRLRGLPQHGPLPGRRSRRSRSGARDPPGRHRDHDPARDPGARRGRRAGALPHRRRALARDLQGRDPAARRRLPRGDLHRGHRTGGAERSGAGVRGGGAGVRARPLPGARVGRRRRGVAVRADRRGEHPRRGSPDRGGAHRALPVPPGGPLGDRSGRRCDPAPAIT